MKIIPTKEQIDYAKEYLTKGSIANRGTFDGDYFKQLFGLVGQIIILDLLNLPRPINSGFDGGYDLIYKDKKYDVKTVIRTVDFRSNFVHNLSGYQKDYKIDGYIFLSYNSAKGEYTICGWIYKEDYFKLAKHFMPNEQRVRDDGSVMVLKHELYELENKYLNNIKTL